MSLFIYGRLSSARFVIGALHGVRSALTEEGVRKDEMAFLFRRSILADSVSSLSKIEI
jgi:hypothetical protein